MLNKISLRKRILILRISLLAIFFSLIFSFTDAILERMVHHALKKGGEGLVVDLRQTDDRDAMARYLIDNQSNFFSIQLWLMMSIAFFMIFERLINIILWIL